MTERLRVIVTGLLAQHPGLGGVGWDYAQYAVGLARLGHDVYYFEDSGEWPYNTDGGPTGDDWVARDCTPNVSYLADVMARFGLAGHWAYRFPVTGEWFGLPEQQRNAVIASADLLVNVSGTLERPEDYRQVKRLAFIDSDPVFTQVKIVQGSSEFRRRVDAHDVHFSFGEHHSKAMPDTGHRWRPTRQPIVLSEWCPTEPWRDAYTTIMSWTSYKPLVHRGELYGQKDREFLRFIDVPRRAENLRFEVAVSGTEHIDWRTSQRRGSANELQPYSTHDLLSRAGWRIVDPAIVCSGLDAYRAYVQSSKAEWSVAKHGYVQGQPGWFSCRSACYLAAGRPVVVEDTGFGAVLPVGEGILPFRTLDEALRAVQSVEEDYPRHSRAARAIAEEYFDSRTVLTRLVEASMAHE